MILVGDRPTTLKSSLAVAAEKPASVYGREFELMPFGNVSIPPIVPTGDRQPGLYAASLSHDSNIALYLHS